MRIAEIEQHDAEKLAVDGIKQKAQQMQQQAKCYLAPLWRHLDRGLMVPLKSRANGATGIAA